MKKVIVLAGPTGSGKTALSIEIAKHFDLEIINGDSVQIFKELNIGSAKIKELEKEGIKHHLLDIKSVSESFSVCEYQKIVREKINDLGVPLIVGGTGLYIRSVLYDYDFFEGKREDILMEKYENLSNNSLYEVLLEKDFEAAKNIHPNNRVRVLRALELADSNKPRSKRTNASKLLYNPLIFYLDLEREILYDFIDKRVNKMLEEGLEKEAKELFDKGFKISAIGYKELFKYFQGEISFLEAIEEIKKNTRHFAKRQVTFFSNQFPLTKIKVDPKDFSKTKKEAILKIKEFIEV